MEKTKKRFQKKFTEEQKKFTFHQKKGNKLLMTLNCFEHKMQRHCIRMESHKIVNFFDTTFDDKGLSRFIKVYDQSEKNYSVNKEIRIKTPMLRSDLCDSSDAYIVVKGIIAKL